MNVKTLLIVCITNKCAQSSIFYIIHFISARLQHEIRQASQAGTPDQAVDKMLNVDLTFLFKIKYPFK